MPLLRDALLGYADRLAAAGVDSPRLSAEVLLAYALGAQRITLVAEAKRPLTNAELVRAEHFISRREKGEPVAYITGTKEFYGLDFAVTPATLIPRPETEHIVEEAQRLFPSDASFRFIDLGTGSGALAVTLAALFPQSTGLALDLSAEALAVARKNAERHGVADRIEFVPGDFRHALPGGAYDLAVANPPYVGREAYDCLDREVALFEPTGALLSGEDGLDHVRGLLPRVQTALRGGGVLLMEIGCDQGTAVLRLLNAQDSGFESGVIISDLAGLDRVVRATRCGSNETPSAS